MDNDSTGNSTYFLNISLSSMGWGGEGILTHGLHTSNLGKLSAYTMQTHTHTHVNPTTMVCTPFSDRLLHYVPRTFLLCVTCLSVCLIVPVCVGYCLCLSVTVCVHQLESVCLVMSMSDFNARSVTVLDHLCLSSVRLSCYIYLLRALQTDSCISHPFQPRGLVQHLRNLRRPRGGVRFNVVQVALIQVFPCRPRQT